MNPTDQMIEAKAIQLFYANEFANLEWIAMNDQKGNREVGDRVGREMDLWERRPKHVRDRFRKRAREEMGMF